MCVILIGKAKDIKKTDLESAWASNPHGAGIAYPTRSRVECIKGIMDPHDLLAALGEIDPKQRIAVHFRYATHGSISSENTHPFKMGRSGSYIMHNGVLSAFGKAGDQGISDSRDLADTLGKLRDAIDRAKILRSLSGMFCTISRSEICTYGSRSWCKIGSVLASNDHFIPKLIPIDRGSRGSRWVDRSLYSWGD